MLAVFVFGLGQCECITRPRSTTLFSGGSRISQSRGRQPQSWGANLLSWQIFLKNCMKVKKKLDPKGGVPGTPLDRWCIRLAPTLRIKLSLISLGFSESQKKTKQQKTPKTQACAPCKGQCTFLMRCPG